MTDTPESEPQQFRLNVRNTSCNRLDFAARLAPNGDHADTRIGETLACAESAERRAARCVVKVRLLHEPEETEGPETKCQATNSLKFFPAAAPRA